LRSLFLLLLAAGSAAAEPASLVYLNGVPSPVTFNDGDSFRVLSGKFAGTKARLAGYNTLESFGPVHQWGTWTAKELYVLAKRATQQAQRGTWRCESDLKTDTYGRMLWWCPELAAAQVRQGLGHAMSVDQSPAKPELIAAQQEAIAAKRGIWAHGVPEYVLTSLHSDDEKPGDEASYNRLVSSADGHSKKWEHKNIYQECDVLCWPEKTPAELLEALKTAGLPEAVGAAYDEKGVQRLLAHYIKDRTVGALEPELGLKEEAHRAPFEAAFAAFLGQNPRACLVHVDFRRRFGSDKAVCLK
jgi:endonuclease YncB( thermonuclease family)